MSVRRLEPWLIVLVSAAVTLVPFAFRPWGHTVAGICAVACLFAAGAAQVWWRRAPALTLVGGGALVLGGAAVAERTVAADVPNLALLICTALAFGAGLAFGGRAAWTSGAAVLAWVAVMYLVTGETDAGLVMFTVPGFVAGTVLRLRRETAAELELRGQELEAERELFAQLAVRNERARIASELHDIIGHSLSVMVVQATAGQRLLQRESPAAQQAGADALAVVAESARQGRDELARLVELLGGQDVASPDLMLMDEIVDLAAASGLQVTCRFEGDRNGVSADAAAVAFRVVRESLTNALRYAPGAAVRVLLRGADRTLEVRVENDPPVSASQRIVGTGSGLRGLRELVERDGGRLTAAATDTGGFAVEARLQNG